MVKIEGDRVALKATSHAASAEILDCPNLSAVPADHLEEVQAGFAIAVDPMLCLMHLGELLREAAPNASVGQVGGIV